MLPPARYDRVKPEPVVWDLIVGLRAVVLSQLAMQVAAAVQIALSNIEPSNPTY
jgi:hypothetical protein